MTYTSSIFRHSKKLKNASGLVRHHDHATIVRWFTSNASPSVDDTAWQYSSRRFSSQAKSDPKFRAINPPMMVGIREGNCASKVMKLDTVTAGSAFTGRFSWSQLKASRGFSTDSGYPPHQEIGMPSLSPTMQEDADKKGLSKISEDVKSLAQKAENSRKPEDYEGGSFTVSNLGGPFGIGQFCAIINPPRAGILAVGSALRFASFMHTLNRDHRVIDGKLEKDYYKNGFSTFPTQKESQKVERQETYYISGARLVGNEQVRISLTRIYGIGPKKAVQLCSRLGISGNTKIKELTKYQIHQMQQIISRDHVVHYELKRRERADIDRFISIYCYRGIRHQDGLPLRGQRTHTNARTCRKNRKSASRSRARV